MNVYSLRLFPSLKLKFCEFFGIASTLAIEELQGRVDRLEVVMSRLDSRMRRSTRRAPVIFQTLPTPVAKAKPANKAPPVKNPAAVVVSTPVQEIKAVSQTQALPVVLIQADEETRKVVGEYFKATTPVVDIPDIQALPERLQGQTPQAVFFDRMLLAQEESRALLEKISQDFPGVRLVGLSSYLTLAFSQSMPNPKADFAAFLTKPLNRQGLAELFGAGSERAIS